MSEEARAEPLFGIFPIPESRELDRIFEIVIMADRSGIDLVTIQDHPYQGTFLDTWTLLSNLAAVTTKSYSMTHFMRYVVSSEIVVVPTKTALGLTYLRVVQYYRDGGIHIPISADQLGIGVAARIDGYTIKTETWVTNAEHDYRGRAA